MVILLLVVYDHIRRHRQPFELRHDEACLRRPMFAGPPLQPPATHPFKVFIDFSLKLTLPWSCLLALHLLVRLIRAVSKIALASSVSKRAFKGSISIICDCHPMNLSFCKACFRFFRFCYFLGVDGGNNEMWELVLPFKWHNFSWLKLRHYTQMTK